MYDVVMELTGAGGHKALVHQLIMVSALGRSAAESAAGKAELGERHKKLFEGLREGRQWVSFSGLLLLYQNFCLHVIEAPPDTIGEITTYITDLKSEGILGTTKILFVPSVSFHIDTN